MIDSHCHLYFDKFGNRQAEFIDRAAKAGVQKIVNIGIDLPTSKQAIELAEKFDVCYATIGVHPHDASTYSDAVEKELREMAKHPKVVAIGEIGLDFYRNNSPRPIQHEVYYRQLKLAAETGLPIVIHSRESFDECLTKVREFRSQLSGGVFHCFPGDEEQADQVIEHDFLLGLGGVVTFDKSAMSRVAAYAPLESIIIETDAPFLAPVPHRGKTSAATSFKIP